MSTKSSLINTTDLDFNDIAENLKSYLKGQTIFKDYDFEGSNINVLVDMMAYASHIGALNTNIAASEMFLDSAQIRKNVVSRAKDLGFVPASEKTSSAVVDIKASNIRNADQTIPTENDMILPRGHNFTTVYDGVSYNFVCVDSVTPIRDNMDFTYSNVNISQGQYSTDQYIFDNQIKNAKFVLSNARVDKSTLEVSVNSDGSTSKYTLSTDVSTITSSTKVFYTQENEEGFIEIYFGDGVLGQGLLDGDQISVTYIIVDDIHADGAKSFTMADAINGFTNVLITTSTPANGGAEKESIDSIKFKATKFYTSQNRLVTLNDYKAKVSEYYPNADAVAVWGGEDNDPPQYGKVFISLKPQNSDYLSEIEKSEVQGKLNQLNMLTVRPEIVDAEIVKILITSIFKYNENETTLSKGELEALVKNTIVNFDNTNLNNFDSIFRHSNLVKSIDDTDTSIISNITNIRLKKKKTITLNKSEGLVINFGNGFFHPHDGHNKDSGGILSTTGFKVDGDTVNTYFFDDDGSGNVRRYSLSGTTRVIADQSAGTIDYTSGKVSINAIKFTSTVNNDTSIDYTVIPSSDDVVAIRGSLIDISIDDIKTSGEIDTITSGESSAGVGYTSTSSSSY
tara:strand:- start:10634 stop:12505 length:1872 start_codon:yes stop_codon:yes gene_type:complete